MPINFSKCVIRVGVLSFLLLLTGCGSILSGGGPRLSPIVMNTDESAYALIDLSAQTIGQYMRAPERVLTATVALPAVPEVRLSPGDVLRVVIADSANEGSVFAPLSTGGTTFQSVRVDSAGRISLPYVGRPSVKGMTLVDVEEMIHRKLRGVTSDAQVQVELAGDISGSVLVVGAVKAPGRFSALQGPLTLLDAINRAGGPVLEPHLIQIVVRTGKRSYEFNYEDLLAGNNQLVPPNSEIVVERARKRFVSMGAVSQPGLHDLPSSNPSLLEVLGSVGGLNEAKADPSGVFVFRLRDAAKSGETATVPRAEVFRLNMKDPAAIFLARQFLVLPEDAVYVTNAAVYEWQKIISPIVQVLLLGRTIDNL